MKGVQALSGFTKGAGGGVTEVADTAAATASCIRKLKLALSKSSGLLEDWGSNDPRGVRDEHSFLTQVPSEDFGDSPFGLETSWICENAVLQRAL